MTCPEGVQVFCRGGNLDMPCAWQGSASDLAKHEDSCPAVEIVMLNQEILSREKSKAERQKRTNQLEADLQDLETTQRQVSWCSPSLRP